MPDMFCFQCQQTAGGKGCVQVGVCGKQPDTANLQDELVIELIHLARAARNSAAQDRETARLLADGLFTTLTNVNFRLSGNSEIYSPGRRKAGESGRCGETIFRTVEGGDRHCFPSLHTFVWEKGMAAYAHHCMNLGL